MLKNKSKLTKVITLILIVNLNICFCQTNAKKNVSNYFDQTIGDDILNINNGTIHIDAYNLEKDNHNYYTDRNFVIGSVFYNKQLYENILIKYDIYKDELVKSFQKSNSFGITLISQKTDFFIIGNTKFVNLTTKYKNQKDITGFFEEKYLGNKVVLYIKHFKTAKEVIIGTTLYTEFKEYSDQKLFYQSKFQSVKTEKEVISVFPQLKTEIKNFYKKNKYLEKSNPDQFKANLANYIDTIL